MNNTKIFLTLFLFCLSGLFIQCDKEDLIMTDGQDQALMGGENGEGLKQGKPGGETAGNNLSFPVIWAEGITKVLPGTAGMDPILTGEWWYQWGSNGTDPDVTPASCPPDPDASDPLLNPDGLALCDDGVEGSVDLDLVAGFPAADNPLPLAKAFIQKDPLNVWQAESMAWPNGDNVVDWIDWGDNLESVDWYTRSQVRTEVVLFEDNNSIEDPWLEYEMRHTSGWGIDEVHGMAATLDETPAALFGPGTRATIYSRCARLTIQKLLVDRDDPRVGEGEEGVLVWDPEASNWKEPDGYPEDLINEHIFNGSVHEGGDGPGYYSAEINVKGRIIYGYTWNVRKLNDLTGIPLTAAGDYRITFSFDEFCGTVGLNTDFVDGTTEIMVPLEEEIIEQVALAEADDSGDDGGGTGVLKGDLNLTYMDVRILERGGGGGGGGGNNGGGGGGGGGPRH